MVTFTKCYVSRIQDSGNEDNVAYKFWLSNRWNYIEVPGRNWDDVRDAICEKSGIERSQMDFILVPS